MENYYIAKVDRGWNLKKKGATRPSKSAGTKAEIITLAGEFLSGRTASLKIHSEDGTIEEERTYLTQRRLDQIRRLKTIRPF